MPANSHKVEEEWRKDTIKSVDRYNDWFTSFSPKAYQDQKEDQADIVEDTMEKTDYFQNITADFLKENPLSIQTLRQATAPPLARDRLIGLAGVKNNLVESMEETNRHDPRVPPRMDDKTLVSQLQSVRDVIEDMIDRDICPWLEREDDPEEEEVRRAANVIADRLCRMSSDPIIRNAQETLQREKIEEWIQDRGYIEVESSKISDMDDLRPGEYTFGCIVRVENDDGDPTNLPMDCIVKPIEAKKEDNPIFIEMKSAGDFTNPNKRRKEEAEKIENLRREFGEDVTFVLFLHGYFDRKYLRHEARAGLDWVWEHRTEDLASLGL